MRRILKNSKNVEELLREGNLICLLCDTPLKIGRKEHGHVVDNSPSVDKIVPQNGYTRGNMWIICYRCNRIKDNATPEELIRIGERTREKRDSITLAQKEKKL